MGRVYVPSSEPLEDDEVVEAEPVTGRVYLPPSQSPKQAAKAAAKAARAEARARAEAEAAAEQAKADAAAGNTEPPPPNPDPAADAPPVKPDEEPDGNATREVWAEYALTRRGASPDDLLEDGKPLGRNALREKYGTPAE